MVSQRYPDQSKDLMFAGLILSKEDKELLLDGLQLLAVNHFCSVLCLELRETHGQAFNVCDNQKPTQ